MNDQTVWEQAITTASNWYSMLDTEFRSELDELLEEIMLLKQKLVALVTSSGSTSVCRTCGGKCCQMGKYHVSVLDVLAFRKTEVKPVTPDFSATPACPYSGTSGCLMVPGYRPVICVIFNCQSVEELLTPNELDFFHEQENRLRALIAHAGNTYDIHLRRPLLLSCN